MPARLVVLGSSNTDMIVRLERIPRPGETILGGEFVTAAGGKGANQAVAAARAGGRVAFVARVGRDSLGDLAVAGFLRDGIDVTHVGRDPETASGVALIFVARDGENAIAVAGGANLRLSPSDVREARPAFAAAETLLTQLETPIESVETAAELAGELGLRFILNPAPARTLSDELLARVSILTPNETEVELLTGVAVHGEADARRAAADLRRRGVGTVIITLGSKGAYVMGEEFTGIVPGFSVDAVDTTAAGDVFNGALAVALGEGRPLDQAVRFANAAAAISVTRLGAQPSAPTRAEIEARVDQL
jgi:ribokinase